MSVLFEKLYELCIETQVSVLENDDTRKILDMSEKLAEELRKYLEKQIKK